MKGSAKLFSFQCWRINCLPINFVLVLQAIPTRNAFAITFRVHFVYFENFVELSMTSFPLADKHWLRHDDTLHICCIHLPFFFFFFKSISSEMKLWETVNKNRKNEKWKMKYIKMSAANCEIMNGCISEFRFCVLLCYTSLVKSK